MMPASNFSDMNSTASAIAFVAGMWGAILNFLKRDISKIGIVRKIGLFFMDTTVSMGITMLVYIGALGYGMNELVSVAIAGALGHQGTRAFYIMELILAEKLGAKHNIQSFKR
jgi:hypothetical protein